jgi:hypothetical protein
MTERGWFFRLGLSWATPLYRPALQVRDLRDGDVVERRRLSALGIAIQAGVSVQL